MKYPDDLPDDLPQHYKTLTDIQKQSLQLWIRLVMEPRTMKLPYTSYGLKHEFEEDGFYVHNGQFKGAMLAAGYLPTDETQQNWTFRIKPRCRHTGKALEKLPHRHNRRFVLCMATDADTQELQTLVKEMQQSH